MKVGTNLYLDLMLPTYLETMDHDELFPVKKKRLLQQNMAPAHSSKRSIDFQTSQGLNTWGKGQWSGNSPDFNVIEHIWAQFQDSVLVKPMPTNLAEIIARITET